MPVATTAYAKNIIRRSVQELVDPSPKRKDIDQIWLFFQNSCAYCGVGLERSKKEGHIDHLVPAAKGGANGLSNRVLSCANCNEKEKLDSDWKQFLAAKIRNVSLRRERIDRIEAWIKQNDSATLELSQEKLQLISSATQRVFDRYDEEVQHIRTVVKRV